MVRRSCTTDKCGRAGCIGTSDMSPSSISGVNSDTPLWLCAPFGVLLLLIALMPLSPAPLKHCWERYYAHVSITLAVLIGAYFAFQGPAGVALLGHTVHDYFSFISLVGSLFVISRVASMPFSSGRPMSMRTTAGRS